MRTARADTGMTLIELVVAMAVFALVAVMGLQSLSGTMRGQSRAAALDHDHAALARATTLLRQDLRAVLPMLFFAPGGGAPASAMQALPNDTGFALSRASMVRLDRPGMPDRAGRVIWSIDGQTLTRRTWPTLTPASPGQQRPAQQVLDRVDAMDLRSYWTGFGWVPGLTPPATSPPPGPPPATPGGDTDTSVGAAAPEVYSDMLPIAVEVTLITQGYGRITLLESLQ